MDKKKPKKAVKAKSARLKKSASKLVPNWHGAIIADYAQLLHWPGVQYLGVGFKETKGKLTRRRCVVIYVREKGSFRETQRLPAKTRVLLPAGKGTYAARWLPTDVIKASHIGFAVGPVRAGSDLAANGKAATAGCMVRVSGDNTIYCLTAGHLFVTPTGNVPGGVVVVQPAPNDPSSAQFGVTASQPLGLADNMSNGYVDWAMVVPGTNRTIDANSSADPKFTFSKRILSEQEIGSAILMRAEKLGAPKPVGTGPSTGQLRAVLPSILVNDVRCFFVLEISNPGGIMGTEGDSGALVVSRSESTSGAVVGIVFAVNDSGDTVYAFPLARVSPTVTMA